MYKGSMTKKAATALPFMHLLVSFGADADHVEIADGTKAPVGTCPDTPAAEEATCVSLLGCASESVPMLAASAIAVDVDVFATADGKICALPSANGTYYCVGKSLESATAENDDIQVDPCKAYAVTVG